MTHPLTDKMIDQIQMSHGGPCFECYPDLRAAYDKGAADMLEQVIEQWEETFNSNRSDIEVIREFYRRLDRLRSQEDN